MLPTRRKKPAEGEELTPKKKTTGKRGKSERPSDVDNELFTKGGFSGTQIIADDLGPDIPPETAEEEKARTPSARRDTRKQAAPVSAKVLEFKRPTGKVALKATCGGFRLRTSIHRFPFRPNSPPAVEPTALAARP